eukprot:3341478-Pyramimonas_sp.AAC.1
MSCDAIRRGCSKQSRDDCRGERDGWLHGRTREDDDGDDHGDGWDDGDDGDDGDDDDDDDASCHVHLCGEIPRATPDLVRGLRAASHEKRVLRC